MILTSVLIGSVLTALLVGSCFITYSDSRIAIRIKAKIQNKKVLLVHSTNSGDVSYCIFKINEFGVPIATSGNQTWRIDEYEYTQLLENKSNRYKFLENK